MEAGDESATPAAEGQYSALEVTATIEYVWNLYPKLSTTIKLRQVGASYAHTDGSSWAALRTSWMTISLRICSLNT